MDLIKLARDYIGGAFSKRDALDSGVEIEDDLGDDALIGLWREMFQLDLNADQNDREEAQRDNEFVNAGDIQKEQWDPQLKAQRIAANRPVLQTNLCTAFIQQIVNEGSRNSPAIGITQSDNGTKENAEYFQHRIRQIEYESNAQTDWDRIRDQQVTCGRGAMRIVTKAIPGKDTKDAQRLSMQAIPNQFSVVWDRGADEYDCSDADHVWIVTRMTPAEHTRRFGAAATERAMDFTDGALSGEWVSGGSDGSPRGRLIQVAELIKKRYKMQVQIGPDEWLWEDQLPPRSVVPVETAGKRKELYCIAIYLFNGVEILPPPAGPPPDEPEARYSKWLTLELPVVPIWGPESIVNGEKRRRSLIRPAKDAQRLVNFYDSSIAEMIGQMPKSPWWIEFGSIPKGHEQFLAEINSTPRAFMYYLGGAMQGGVWRQFNPPKREVAEPPIQAMTIAREQAVQAMKAAMGIFDAARGDRSNETSGVAIERRQAQSGIVNFHFPRNENRTRKRVGEILVSAIKVLDTKGGEYAVREIDGTTRMVPIGVEFEDPKTGKPITVDLKGNYTLVVETTVNYETARREERAFLVEVIKAEPALFWILGDKIFYLSDVPGSQEMGDRVKAAINMKTPGLIADSEDGKAPIPPEVQQELMSLQRELMEAKAFAEEQLQKIATDEAKQAAETQRKVLDIEAENARHADEMDFKREELTVKTNTEMAKLGMQEAVAELKAQIDVINTQLGISQQIEEREMAATMAEADRDSASAEAQTQREHELEVKDRDQTFAADQAEAAFNYQDALAAHERAANGERE